MKMLVFLLLASTSSIAVGFQCPVGQYLYRNCSVCFFPSPSDHTLTFEEASSFCAAGGGALLSFSTQGDLYRVGRYLVGLQQERQEFWVGYRHNATKRVAEDGGPASQVVLNTTNFITERAQPGPTRCIGVKGGGKLLTRSCTTELHFICEYFYAVPVPRDMSPENGVVYARLGSSISLSATIPFPGVYDIIWMLNGSNITANRNGIEIMTRSMELEQMLRSTLTISEFSFDHHYGSYLLAVRNAAGVAMVMEWHTREPALGPLIYVPTDLSVTRGQIAAFECHAPNSAPSPTVRWYKDSSQRPLQSSGRVYVSQETGLLYIREVAAGDAGMYRCVLENMVGTRMSGSARLTVATSFPRGVAPPGPAKLYFPLRPKTLTLGEPLVIDCVGHFTATIIVKALGVYQEGSFISTNQFFLYPNQTGFPQFSLDSVGSRSGDITYYCALFHEHYLTDAAETGNFVTENSTVTVHGAAFISKFYTEWNGTASSSISRSIPRVSDVTIHCNFGGRPRPGSSAAKWYRNGLRINSGVSTSDSISVLTVSDFIQSAVYQCHVTNMYGSDIASVFLCLEQQDAIPDVVSFVAVPNTNTSIYVEWTGDNSGTDPLLLRYHVSVSVNSSMEMNFNLLAGARNLVINDLEPIEIYSVRVQASSMEGVSEVPHPQNVSTFPNIPTEPFPDSVVTAVFNSTTLVVSWDTFTPTSGPPLPPPTSYQVQLEYQVVGGTSGQRMDTIVAGTERQAVIPVDGDYRYEVRIRLAVQHQRDPPAYSYSPWTSYIRATRMADEQRPPTMQQLTTVLLAVGASALLGLFGLSMMLWACWLLLWSNSRFSLARKRNYRITSSSSSSLSMTETCSSHLSTRYTAGSESVTEEGCEPLMTKPSLATSSFTETQGEMVKENLAARSFTEGEGEVFKVKENLAARSFTEGEGEVFKVKENLAARSFTEGEGEVFKVKENLAARSFKEGGGEVFENLAARSFTEGEGETSKVWQNFAAHGEESGTHSRLKEGSETRFEKAHSPTEEGSETHASSEEGSETHASSEEESEAHSSSEEGNETQSTESESHSSFEEENEIRSTSEQASLQQKMVLPIITVTKEVSEETSTVQQDLVAPDSEEISETSLVHLKVHSRKSSKRKGAISIAKQNQTTPIITLTEEISGTSMEEEVSSSEEESETSMVHLEVPDEETSTVSSSEEESEASMEEEESKASMEVPDAEEESEASIDIPDETLAVSSSEEESETSMEEEESKASMKVPDETSIVQAVSSSEEESEASMDVPDETLAVSSSKEESETSMDVPDETLAVSSSKEESETSMEEEESKASMAVPDETSIVQAVSSTEERSETSMVKPPITEETFTEQQSPSFSEEKSEASPKEQDFTARSHSFTARSHSFTGEERQNSIARSSSEGSMVRLNVSGSSSSFTGEERQNSIARSSSEGSMVRLNVSGSSSSEERDEAFTDSSYSADGLDCIFVNTILTKEGVELETRPSGKYHSYATQDRKRNRSI